MDPARVRQRVRALRGEGARVGFVPTMGALHSGHLSLVEAARRECEACVASVFVNPTQFGPGEDYQRYPRDLDRDRKLLGEVGCDAVFAPTPEAMYPAGFETRIDVGSVAAPLEGERRPTHFAGVATVVLKLLNIVPADAAYFGQKDYQQTVVIRRMVADLNVPVEVRICPTLRERDGLAMSSRNAYLSAEERTRALCLSAGLKSAEQLFALGERRAAALRTAALEPLLTADVDVDYVALVREGTVEPVEYVEGPTVVLVAARVGKTRLIDNIVLR